MNDKSGKFNERGKVSFHSNDDSLQSYTYELQKEISLLKKEKGVLLEAVGCITGLEWDVKARSIANEALEKLKEIRE